MKVWIWLKPTGLEHKHRPALSVKTPEWFLNVVTLDPVPTYSWIVALGVRKTGGISRLSLPCIPFSDLRAFLLIVVSSLWANINLNKMTEVINVILLEAVGWGIGPTRCCHRSLQCSSPPPGELKQLPRPQGGCYHACYPELGGRSIGYFLLGYRWHYFCWPESCIAFSTISPSEVLWTVNKIPVFKWRSASLCPLTSFMIRNRSICPLHQKITPLLYCIIISGYIMLKYKNIPPPFLIFHDPQIWVLGLKYVPVKLTQTFSNSDITIVYCIWEQLKFIFHFTSRTNVKNHLISFLILKGKW